MSSDDYALTAALLVSAVTVVSLSVLSGLSLMLGGTVYTFSMILATVLASAQRLGVTKLGMVGNEQFVK